MDIWSRLLGGSSPAKKAENTPQQRLIRFKKVHDQLQLIWRRNNASAHDVPPLEPLLHCLQNIRAILQNEVQTPSPHLCARHVATFHIYSTIAQLAAIYPNDGIIREALVIFKSLLDSEEGDFAKDKAFADALLGFISTALASVLPVDIEAAAAEVLFYVAAKLRSEPQLLPTWFRPDKKGRAQASATEQSKDKEEFLLFYMILDYVHYDGRTGDFARTGLLYLIESAGQSAALEQWVIESDLATLLASGLGALYSQLSRKLVLAYDEESMPAVITFSQEGRPKTPNDADKTSSPEFKAHLQTFLSYLTFWQDVLDHCNSTDVKQSLLDHFKFLFLQQLLYPSLIESSDRDGGSSVAVLTYLKCIMETIDHPDLVQLTFEYLLAIRDTKVEEKPPTRPTALARRRRSQTLVANLAQGQDEKPLPELFNLHDLVLASLQSTNQPTVAATLRLISAMLQRHHQYDVSLIPMGCPGKLLSLRPLDTHERNTKALFRIIESLNDDSHLGEAYETHLEDAQNLLESHACSLHLMAPPNAGGMANISRVSVAAPTASSGGLTTDPVLSGLISLLDDFFVNEIETNLSLTQVFATTSSCAKRVLDGWFLDRSLTFLDTPKPRDRRTSTAEDTADTELQEAESFDQDDGNYGRDDDGQSTEIATPLFTTLNSLVLQVDNFRRDIENFDIYLSECRHVFKVGEESENAVKGDAPSKRGSQDSEASSRPTAKRIPPIGSISQRLMSQPSTANASPTRSPRGRQAELPSTPLLLDRLSHLRQSASGSPQASAERAVSPSPLRKGISSDSPAERPSTPMGPPDALSQKLRVKVRRAAGPHIWDVRSDVSSVRSESGANEAEQYREVTLSHVLTNVIILQEFVLEMVAIVQVRASMFGEVTFD